MKNLKHSSTSKKQNKTEAKVPKFRYVVRKYVVAKTLQEALANEAKSPVHEVFVAEASSDDRPTSGAIGFEYEVEE